MIDATAAEERIRTAVEQKLRQDMTSTCAPSLGIESRNRRVLPSIGAGSAERATIFSSKDDIHHRHRGKRASKYAGDLELRIFFFPTAQIPTQRPVATLSTTRKCQNFIYFLLLLRHINGNLSSPICVRSAITRTLLVSASKDCSRPALRCIARTTKRYVLAQSPPGP